MPSIHGLSLAHPERLYLLAIVALCAIYWLWQAGRLGRWPAPILRAVAAALLVLALADPHSVAHSEGATRPVLLDLSASITRAMREYGLDLIRNQFKMREADPAIMFAANSRMSTVGAAAAALEGDRGCAECGPGATDLEAALNALSANPMARGGPIAVVTDGWENHGNAATALNALRAAGVQLYIFTPPGARAIPNVAMTQMTLPSVLEKAAPFAIGVSLDNLNSVPAAGKVVIYQNGAAIDQREVTLAPGETRLDFPVRGTAAGLASYRAIFKPANPALDAYPQDDSLEGWVGIGAQRKVLILTDNTRDANYLEIAVRRMGLQPAVVNLAAGLFGGDPKDYDAVILNNVPRARLSPGAQKALVRYVMDGGALAMVGGDQSFGLGGYEGSSIAAALPVVMKPPEHHESKRALVLIIDKSGSMGRNSKLTYAKAAAATVTSTLKDNDLIGVIGFDSQPFVVVPLEPLAQVRPYFAQLINRLAAHGTTYLLPALEEADRTLIQSGAAIKHVVILTDGETGGTASMYYDLVSSMHHEQAATISAIAIGREANLPLLEAIARYGGGGFYQTDSPENLPDLFIEDVRQRGGTDTTMVEKSFQPRSVSPDPVLRELAGERLPPLKGFVATDLKPGAVLSMFVESNGRRDPLLATWKYGAGKALAITTDASGRWSSEWVRNGVYAPIWDKILTWMIPQNVATTRKFGVALGYNQGRITINLTDYSDNPNDSNAPLDAIVTAPDGTRFETILSQRAAGELSGSFDAWRPGTYHIAIKAPRAAAANFPPMAYTVTPAVQAELPQPEPNYGLLEQLASASGGRLNPDPREFAISRPLFEHGVALGKWPIIAAMISLICEALVRRLTF